MESDFGLIRMNIHKIEIKEIVSIQRLFFYCQP